MKTTEMKEEEKKVHISQQMCVMKHELYELRVEREEERGLLERDVSPENELNLEGKVVNAKRQVDKGGTGGNA